MSMLEKSINYLEKIKKIPNIGERLAKEGEPIIHQHFDTAENQDSDYITVIETKPDCVILSAVGEDVMFREFGAGVDTETIYPLTNTEGLPPIAPASYSSTEGTGEFAKYGSWHHKKVKMTGVKPTLGMYYASLKMRTILPQLMKELMK